MNIFSLNNDKMIVGGGQIKGIMIR